MIRIYGYSDDTVEVEGDEELDMSIPAFNEVVSLFVATEDGKCLVTMLYNDFGVWSASVSQLDEDVPIPKISLSNMNYTVVVEVYGEQIKVEKA